MLAVSSTLIVTFAGIGAGVGAAVSVGRYLASSVSVILYATTLSIKAFE